LWGAASNHAAKARRNNKDAGTRNSTEVVWFYPRLVISEARMDGIIYLVGLIVIIMAILSFFGLR
jgi:hypothetical protein